MRAQGGLHVAAGQGGDDSAVSIVYVLHAWRQSRPDKPVTTSSAYTQEAQHCQARQRDQHASRRVGRKGNRASWTGWEGSTERTCSKQDWRAPKAAAGVVVGLTAASAAPETWRRQCQRGELGLCLVAVASLKSCVALWAGSAPQSRRCASSRCGLRRTSQSQCITCAVANAGLLTKMDPCPFISTLLLPPSTSTLSKGH